MKTFTAEQFSNKPAQVFREADVNGSVKINHQHYPDKVFILEGRERRAGCEHDLDDNMVCAKCGEQCARFTMPSPMALMDGNGGFRRPMPYKEDKE